MNKDTVQDWFVVRDGHKVKNQRAERCYFEAAYTAYEKQTESISAAADALAHVGASESAEDDGSAGDTAV